MPKEYNFSKSSTNPYAKRLKQQVTIRLERETIECFKKLADEIDIPYQKLINIYLRECADKELKPSCPGKPKVYRHIQDHRALWCLYF